MEKAKEVAIKWHPKTQKLYQIPKEGVEFAFVSEDFTQIHQLVWCKDFLQDAIWGHVNKKEISIYGFKYDPATMPPLYLKKTRLIVTNWKDDLFGHKLLNNCLPFLNAIEDQLKMSKTEVSVCKKTPPRYGKSKVWMLEGSRRWMKSPPMISLYTLLIRAGMVHDSSEIPVTTLSRIGNGLKNPYFGGDGHKGASDKANIKKSLQKISFLLNTGDRKIFHREIRKNFPSTCNTGKLHNSYGFVGFSNGDTKTQFPHWHREDLRR